MLNVLAMSLVKTIGIVLYRRTPRGRQYLLLHHRGPYWNFPKGRVEARRDDGELGTAFRELEEETAVPRTAVRLHPGFRVTYRYRFSVTAAGRRQPVVKLAIFYLGRMVHDTAVKVSHEHLGFAWCDANAAWQRLYFSNSRKVLEAAEAYLARRPMLPARRTAFGTGDARPRRPMRRPRSGPRPLRPVRAPTARPAHASG